jgi:ribosomal protein S18 acetylase RimI-like enzyme
MTTPAGGTTQVAARLASGVLAAGVLAAAILAAGVLASARLVRVIGITRRPGADKDWPQPLFHIRPARLSDMAAIIRLIDEAAGWLKAEKGTDQWQRPWPDLPARDQRIRRGIKKGRTWIVEDRTEPAGSPRRLVATVSCGRGGNKKLWTQRERKKEAVYISRLIVSREHKGRGVGAALINWASLRGIKGWDAECTRLDVWTTNLDLQSYYKGQKFEHIRTCDFADPWEYPSAALFQKSASDVDRKDANFFQEVSQADRADDLA